MSRVPTDPRTIHFEVVVSICFCIGVHNVEAQLGKGGQT